MKQHPYNHLDRLYYNIIQRVDDIYEGVTFYQPWRESKELFLSYVELLGARPEGCSLDRVNNAYGYEPMNLRWATHSQQMYNRGEIHRTPGVVTSYKWVRRQRDKFLGKFRYMGKQYHTSVYDTQEEAYVAVLSLREKIGINTYWQTTSSTLL